MSTPDPRPILFLDPSSTKVGWATFTPAGDLLEFGVIEPRAADRPRPERRIRSLGAQTLELARERGVGRVVSEVTTGKVAARNEATAGAGLGMYGMGVGYVVATLDARLAAGGTHVEWVRENDWTRGKPKADRARRVGLIEHRYAVFNQAGHDPGLDAADAIGLGLWWFVERNVAKAIERSR